jgi:hypothetical protein
MVHTTVPFISYIIYANTDSEMYTTAYHKLRIYGKNGSIPSKVNKNEV